MAYGQQEKDVMAPRHQLKDALYDSDSDSDTEMQALMWLGVTVDVAGSLRRPRTYEAQNNGVQ
jgi:hypothetical protein